MPTHRTKRSATMSLFAALALVASAALAAQGATAKRPAAKTAKTVKKQDPAALAIAKGIQGFYERSAGFEAAFTQVVKKRGLKKGIRRKGRVWLRKGEVDPKRKDPKTGKPATDNGKMRWDYPAEEIYYFSDGEVLWSYERRERLAVKLPVKNSRLYQATSYLVGQGDLARDFELSVGKSPIKGTKALKLIPKEGTGVMRSLTLVVDAKSYAVKASILVDPLGDSTSLVFKDAKYGAIADKVFDWKPPKGVKVKTM